MHNAPEPERQNRQARVRAVLLDLHRLIRNDQRRLTEPRHRLRPRHALEERAQLAEVGHRVAS